MNLYGSNPEFCHSSFLGHEEIGDNLMGHEETGDNLMGHHRHHHHHQHQIDPFSYPQYCNEFGEVSVLQQPFDECHIPNNNMNLPLEFEDGDHQIEVPEIPDTCFNYISSLLREEGADDRPGATLHDYMAAQLSYSRSLDAALVGESCSFVASQCPPTVCQNSTYNCVDDYLNMFSCSPSTSVTDTIVSDNNNNNNNFLVNSLVGNSSSIVVSSSNSSTSEFWSTLIRSLPDDDQGVVPAPASAPAPVPLITRGEETNQGEQGFDMISNGNWVSDHSVANGLDSGAKQKEPLRGNNLPSDQGGGNYQQKDMNLCSINQFEPSLMPSPAPCVGLLSSNCLSNSAEDITRMVNSLSPINVNGEIVKGVVQCNDSTSKSRGRKHGEGDEEEIRDETGRNNKQLAPSSEVFEHIEQYGDVLLCPEGRSKPAGLCSSINSNRTSNSQNSEDRKSQKEGASSSKGSKKRGNKVQVVDLKGLLTHCAQCVARVDLSGAYETLKQIRQHSSPYGDCLQRVAHYLANALEARLEGTGLELTRANEQVLPSDVLKANRVFVASVPFKIMSYYTTNKTIASLAEKASSIHIIDFGISYGLQWPCIIQNLSKVPTGPPRVRITGIDFPERGFRPAERVEETGNCLARYCERYNVPFEYNAIAKKWEDIQLDDLKIERNEPLVVNCLYRSHNLFDEGVEDDSPRDAFLSLVRKINPDIFMHGIVNSTSSVPFFLNRFKEALFHFTALFDLFEATMSREDNERMLLESKLYGTQALNVIACEGTERVERPEAYKQWQVRTQRAGFVQVPLDRELLKRARAMVRRNFREEFSYDEDGHWVVQGWKGRILYAISCWKPKEV